MTQPLLQAADLRGARLSTDAVAGLAGLVEAMHARAASQPLLRAHDEGAVDGSLAGLLHGAARGATHAVGSGAEALFGWLAPALTATDPREPPDLGHEAVVAALNGLLGDHLAATDNPLAIRMAFRRAGAPLTLERLALRAGMRSATPKLLVLLHDLCMNDLHWQHADHDHGEALARESGYTPIYLHYNSGLSVSTNGRVLAPLMEKLYDAWPMPIERLVLMGHGAGGLVARSAMHHGLLLQRGKLRWTSRVNDLVCLGTPHMGAPLERAGHGVELLLGTTPHATELARLGRMRSAGISDFRLGNVLSGPPGDDGTHRCEQVSLPAGTRSFALAASLGPAGDTAKAKLSGDGLVPVASALGQHAEANRRLAFAADRQAVVHDTNHLELLSSPQVYDVLRRWLG